MARGPEGRGFLGLPLPGRREGAVIAVVLLIAAAFVAASAWYAAQRELPEYTPRAQADGTPAATSSSSSPTRASASPTEEPEARPAVLAFYGDSYVSGTPLGGLGPAGWPAIVSRELGARMAPLHTVPDGGYAQPSTGTVEATYLDLVTTAPEPDADVTVVFGSRYDYRFSGDVVEAAAAKTFAAIRAAAPDTRLLVIGPAWTDAVVPRELPPLRDAIQRAATEAGATFVDPLASRWFFDDPQLIGRDVINPTDAGHLYLAGLIEPAVRQLLAEVPGVAVGEPAASTP